VVPATAADRIPPPQDLYDGGDYHTLRDRSLVSLWRSAREIAVKRAKALPQETVSRAVSAERLVASMDACGSPATHQIEIFSVKDAQQALGSLAAMDGVVWASPVLSTPGSGKRVLLCDEVALELSEEADKEALFKDLATRGLTVVEGPKPMAPRLYLLKLAQRNVETMLAEANALAQVPGIAWAEPNFLVELETCLWPSDPFFARQQSLHNSGQNGAMPDADVDAPEAWDIRTGNERLVIAILDTGVDTGHPDLNFFRNDGEWGGGRENNGVDDDGNGYVDDHQGWDFWAQDNNPNPGTSPEAAHGTSCAGVAGAKGYNSTGISGVAQSCRILPVKIQDDSGVNFTPSYQIGNSIRYAAQFADVISCSWGQVPVSSTIDSAIDYATNAGRFGRGCPVIAASGNDAGIWTVRTRFVSIIVTPGIYRIGFRCISLGPIYGSPIVAIDQVRLLARDGYTNHWRDDFESVLPGWTVLHQGPNITDWWLTDESLYRRPGSTWCWRTPNLRPIPAGEWTELRSPPVNLTNQHVLALMTGGQDTIDFWGNKAVEFQVRLYDVNNQFISLLNNDDLRVFCGSGQSGWIAYPASRPNVIAVGACTDLGFRASYSQYGEPWHGSQLFCVAPSSGGWNPVVTTDTVGTNGFNNGL
jgi:hypothetical protein